MAQFNWGKVSQKKSRKKSGVLPKKITPNILFWELTIDAQN